MKAVALGVSSELRCGRRSQAELSAGEVKYVNGHGKSDRTERSRSIGTVVLAEEHGDVE